MKRGARKRGVALGRAGAAGLLSALGVLGLTTGCGAGPDRSGVTRTDSAGVEIVTSTVDDRPLPWTLERGVALGGAEEGPESFYRVWEDLTGSDGEGRVYVLDTAAKRVVVFTADGAFVRSVGREGEGPGELAGPASLLVDEDGTVSVFDYGKAGLVRFGADGAVLPQRPFPYYPWPGVNRHIGATSDGILVASMVSPAPEGQFRHALRLMTGSDSIVLAERSFPQPGMAMYPACGGGLNLPRIFEAQVLWATNGHDVAAVDGPEYAVGILRGPRPVREIRAGLPVREATEALAVEELGEGMQIDFGRGPCTIPPREMVEKRGYAGAVPWIAQLTLSPSGELWVRRKEVGIGHPGPVDVFDTTGAYVGTLPAGAPFPVVFLDADHFGATETDEMDVSRLVIYSVHRDASAGAATTNREGA